MPLLIRDDEIRDLVTTLAARVGTTEKLAVKAAVEAALKKLEIEPTPREKLDALLARFPKPNPTGRPADKAFYDELSGEFD